MINPSSNFFNPADTTISACYRENGKERNEKREETIKGKKHPSLEGPQELRSTSREEERGGWILQVGVG